MFVFNNLLNRLVLISVGHGVKGEKTMVGNQINTIFDDALGFWTGSDLAMWSMVASFALCGAFLVHKYQTPKRRKKFSDWRSVKLIAVIPAALVLYFSYVTENYAALPACFAATFLGAFMCYVAHYTAKNPKEFVRFLLLPVWFVAQILILASELLPKKSRA